MQWDYQSVVNAREHKHQQPINSIVSIDDHELKRQYSWAWQQDLYARNSKRKGAGQTQLMVAVSQTSEICIIRQHRPALYHKWQFTQQNFYNLFLLSNLSIVSVLEKCSIQLTKRFSYWRTRKNIYKSVVIDAIKVVNLPITYVCLCFSRQTGIAMYSA